MAFVLQQTYAFIYYDFQGHPLLVNYSNAYRPREEQKSSELSIMKTVIESIISQFNQSQTPKKQ